MLGQTISHCQVLDKLGAGGPGVVWKARGTGSARETRVQPDFHKPEGAAKARGASGHGR
jgi:hypothetical protein